MQPGSADAELDALAALLQQACQPTPPLRSHAHALARIGRLHRVSAGARPFDELTRIDVLWLVADGCVTVGPVDDDGHWRPARSLQRGQWLDAATAWLGLPAAERCMAETDSTLYAFPIAEVEALCERQSALARVLLALLARHVREVTESTHNLFSKDTLARCAAWLLDALQAAGDGATVVLAQRKSTVASQIGTTPETFSRTLRRLREMGTIDVKGARIVVRDTLALRRLVGQPKVRTSKD